MVAPTLSAKLGLLVDPDGELLVDNNYSNWDKVDLASGVQHVDAGQPAPFPYEGALVAERVTGISYTLTSDGLGGWTKRYINYPYMYCAYSPSGPFGYTPNYNQWGWNTYAGVYCVNSLETHRGPNNGWQCPVKGLYQISMMQRWEGPAGGGEHLVCGSLMINGADYTHMENRLQTNPTATCLNVQYIRPFNVGDWVVGIFQNYAPTNQLSMLSSVFISMVRPMA